MNKELVKRMKNSFLLLLQLTLIVFLWVTFPGTILGDPPKIKVRVGETIIIPPNSHYMTWSFVDNIKPQFHLPQFFGTLRFK